MKKQPVNQKFYFFLFLLVMMVPSIFLCYTEPYSLPTVLAALLMPAGAYAVLFSAAKRPGVIMLMCFPLMVLGAFQLVLLYLFGNSVIAVDMFTNLFTTNATEAGELLGNIWPSIVGVCVLYLPALVLAAFSIRSSARLSAKFRRWAIYCGVLLIGIGFLSGTASRKKGREFGVKYHVFPTNAFYNLRFSLKKWDMSLHYPETSENFHFYSYKIKKTEQREVYVLVIGEASRAANWSLFGYDRKTNPLLEKKEGLVVFPDALTMNNATHKSVPMMLAPASAVDFDEIYSQKSIITAFREAGFQTVFISNQVPNRSLIDYFGAEAHRRIDITPHDGSTESNPDGEMVPILRELIDTTDHNLLLVLHTYGSHFNYKRRYPEGFSPFSPDEVPSVMHKYKEQLVNSYDNSVAYTDFVLSEIIDQLARTDAVTALLYCSDHGEDLMDDDRRRFLHSSPTPTYYQLHVAYLVWFSESYREIFPEKTEAALNNRLKPTGTATIFHTMADIGDLRTQMLDISYSMVHTGFLPRERYYLNDHDQPVLFYNSGITEEDFIQLDRRGITYDESLVVKRLY